jgi:hypothetical protein
MKPDVTGIDGVSVTGADGFSNPFHETSAPAPTVAAVSALALSGVPTRIAAQVRTALLSSRTYCGAAGPDDTFGNGRVDAVAFAQAPRLRPPVSITAISPATGVHGSTVEIAGLVGTGFQAGATVGLRRPGHADIPAADVVVVSPEKIACRFALPPPAAFTATPVSGTAPLAVQFTDTSISEGITSWAWTFGDGEPSTLQDPVHARLAAGTCAVALDVPNPGGSDAGVKPGSITLTDPAPPSSLCRPVQASRSMSTATGERTSRTSSSSSTTWTGSRTTSR